MTALALTRTTGTTTTVPANGLSANPYGPFGYHHPVRAEIMARTGSPDYHRWLHHIRPAAGCTTPIRLYGVIDTIEASTGRLLSTIHTTEMPDSVIYKPCGNRRESVCPSCSETYRRDVYQLIKAALVGGKGIPEIVATHPAVFPTFTAPSFGPVHSRHVGRHTCTNRRLCDCRSEPCQPRSGNPRCVHEQPTACFARHGGADKELGRPLCLDCYDHDHQVVWNVMAGELWRRTRIAIERYLQRLAKDRGLDPRGFKLSYGKVKEFQRRAVVHFHALVRLDGRDPDDPAAIVSAPAGIDAHELKAAIAYAAANTSFRSPPHPANPDGWLIAWGQQLETRIVTVAANGEIAKEQVGGYLAKYATKSTEVTGHLSTRLTEDTIDLYADDQGSHTERLIDACWYLGRADGYGRLRRHAHQLSFGGHFFTKSHRFTATFGYLKQERLTWTRQQTTGPTVGGTDIEPDLLVLNFLEFVGSGWHTTGDAILANTSAAMAREQQRVAREELAALAATAST